AACFAVHPVHVEATANVVGQGELWMTLFTTAAVLVYVRARRDGELGGRHRLALAVLYVLAAASKEQGIVLPGLLLAVEWLGIPARPGERKLAIAARTMLLLGVVGVGFLAGRFAVLGDMGGGPPAAGLEGLGIGGRLRVMLPMVPDLIRLLVWPRSLLSQYTPPAYGGPTTTAAAVAGAALLAAVGAAAVLARRRLPAATIGLVWIGVGLLPVSNIPFPTGILIAERTLFLPSVGAALAGGALFAFFAGRKPAWLAPAVAGLLITLGASRSFSRQAVWRDNRALFDQSLIDEPRSYRTYFVAGREYVIEQRPAAAIAAFRRAAELYGGDQRVFEEWGQVLRSQGRCADAIPILERGLALDRTRIVSRSRLVECLLTVGRAEDAANAAREGLALGGTEFQLPLDRALKALARADSGAAAPPARAPAPPGTS
ncbi:MAG: tetratricopeptide repeat protein, partial [Gemmatimonadales bacterium]